MSEQTADATTKKLESNIGTLFVLLVIAGVLFLGWRYFQVQEEEKRRVAVAESAASDRAFQQQLKDTAILYGTVIKGMEKYEVLKSVGRPDDTIKVSNIYDAKRREALLAAGVFEVLTYPHKGIEVMLDVNGTVIHVAR